MTGREIALLVITALTVTAITGLGVAARARRTRPECPPLAFLATAAGVTCGMWAAEGWAWWLSGAVIR